MSLTLLFRLPNHWHWKNIMKDGGKEHSEGEKKIILL